MRYSLRKRPTPDHAAAEKFCYSTPSCVMSLLFR